MAIVQWVGGSSNNFNDSNNWNPHVVPGSTSDVLIAPSAATTIAITNATINTLAANAATTLTIAATDQMTIVGAPDASRPTGASVNAGVVALGSAADLFLQGRFANTGTLATAAASDVWVSSAFVNAGKVQQSGDFTLGGGGHAGTANNLAGASWSISGAVDIANGAAAGSRLKNAGTLTRSGAGVTDVGVATVNTGKVALSSGSMEFQAAVANSGTMSVASGALTFDTAIGGVGKLDVGGGSLNLLTGADSGQTVDFLGKGALDLHAATAFRGAIKDFHSGDLIDLAHVIATSEKFAGGVLTLFDGGVAEAHLHMLGAYSTSSFRLSGDGHGGTLVHFV